MLSMFRFSTSGTQNFICLVFPTNDILFLIRAVSNYILSQYHGLGVELDSSSTLMTTFKGIPFVSTSGFTTYSSAGTNPSENSIVDVKSKAQKRCLPLAEGPRPAIYDIFLYRFRM